MTARVRSCAEDNHTTSVHRPQPFRAVVVFDREHNSARTGCKPRLPAARAGLEFGCGPEQLHAVLELVQDLIAVLHRECWAKGLAFDLCEQLPHRRIVEGVFEGNRGVEFLPVILSLWWKLKGINRNHYSRVKKNSIGIPHCSRIWTFPRWNSGISPPKCAACAHQAFAAIVKSSKVTDFTTILLYREAVVIPHAD